MSGSVFPVLPDARLQQLLEPPVGPVRLIIDTDTYNRDVVRVGARIETQHAPGHDVHHLEVRVDRLRFESYLPGEIGLRAMRDFVDASRARQFEAAHT